MRDLIVIKDTTTSLKDAIHRIQHEDEVRTVVASSSRLNLLRKDFEQMRRTTLTEYDPSLFVIGKEMQYNPTVPEFLYNDAECIKFVHIIG